MSKLSLWLECHLTALDVNNRQMELTEATLAKVKAEEALVGETATWKARKEVLESAISHQEERCRELANSIKTESEMRNVECHTEIMPPNHLTIRDDTGEIVRSRAATTEELQLELEMPKES